jgi:hypothetical protein
MHIAHSSIGRRNRDSLRGQNGLIRLCIVSIAQANVDPSLAWKDGPDIIPVLHHILTGRHALPNTVDFS